MNLGDFVRTVGQNYGRNVMWQQETDDHNANLELKQQQIAANQSAADLADQQAAARARIGQQITAAQQADASIVQDPMKEASLWVHAAGEFAAGGDFDAAKNARQIADSMSTQARQATLDAAKKQQMAKETLSSAALDYSTSPTAEGAAAVARAAVAAGVNPLDIPPPSTPEWKSWVQAQQQASMTGAQRVEQLTKVHEAQLKREAEQQRHADLERDREENRKLRAAIQAGVAEDRKARRQEAATNIDFKQAEKLNTSLQAVAKPILEDRQRIDDVKGLLAVNSPEADQQIRQALTSLTGHFKGRATNLFYQDNKNFGDVAQRLSGWASHAFTGRYTEQARKEISDMLDGMKDMVIDPSLNRIEQRQRKKAEKYGLDPELVGIQGDFNRAGEPSVDGRKPAAAATPQPAGELRRTADGRLLRKNPDGTIEEVK